MANENEETNESTEAKPTITIAEKQQSGSGDKESKDTITIAEKDGSGGKP